MVNDYYMWCKYMTFIIDMEKTIWRKNGRIQKRGHLPKEVYMMGRTAFGYEGIVGKSVEVDLYGTTLLCDECKSIVRYNRNGLAECEKCGLIHYQFRNQKKISAKLNIVSEFINIDKYGFTSEDKDILNKIRR